MKGIYLKLYLQEHQRHGGRLAYEWILDCARSMGIRGGSVFRALAGYGRHGMHESHFYELAGDLPLELVFATEERQATELLDLLESEGFKIFYVKMPVEFGILGE